MGWTKGINPPTKPKLNSNITISRSSERVVRPLFCPYWGPEFESQVRRGSIVLGMSEFGVFSNFIQLTLSTASSPNFILFIISISYQFFFNIDGSHIWLCAWQITDRKFYLWLYCSLGTRRSLSVSLQTCDYFGIWNGRLSSKMRQLLNRGCCASWPAQ